MLRTRAGWAQRFGADLVVAVPPGLGARVRYHERLRPQPAFSAIVERVLAADPAFLVHEPGEMKRVVTTEGEYGAWLAIRGQRGAARAMRWIGAVWMGEFATALDVLALAPEHFAAVEALAYELMCGQCFAMTRRPRQFFYAPPRGWHGLPSGMVANWYPVDFPANRSMIVVPPADFVDADPAGALELTIADLSAGLVVDEHVLEPLRSDAGLEGTYVRLSGHHEGRATRIHRELAGFVAGSYAYHLRLETATSDRMEELHAVFREVAASVKPLPGRDETQTGRAFSSRLALFDHWAE